MIKLPGLIDIHTHLRTPGQEQKEDFFTGTSAALAGGFTTILDMPNNKVPITSLKLLEEKMTLAMGHPEPFAALEGKLREGSLTNVSSNKLRDSSLVAQNDSGGGIVCNVGFYFGSLGNNLEEFEKLTQLRHPEFISGSQEILNPFGLAQGKQVQNDGKSGFMVFGLKLYLNPTTGNFLIDQENLLKIYQAWPSDQPIILHCEGETLPMALDVIRETRKKTHIAHVSSQEELSIIMAAKKEGLPVTCGVTPHHLFLTQEDGEKLGPFGLMKPSLKSKEDVGFLWNNLNSIDIIESDHAPHTKEEKNSDNPPFGVPGLETTLPLLLTAVSEGRLSLEDIKRLCHDNPTKIFNIPTDKETFVEIDETVTYTLNPETFYTKCKWSPFDGWRVKGKVKAVFIRGQKVFEDGKVLAKKGSGKIISPV